MSQLRSTVIKLVVCIISLSALLALFLHSANPAMPPFAATVYVLLSVIIFAAALYITILVRANFNQWSINRGAIDTGWLWFDANPPGLEAIRNPTDAPMSLEKPSK